MPRPAVEIRPMRLVRAAAAASAMSGSLTRLERQILKRAIMALG
jgi:hypothetical protein